MSATAGQLSNRPALTRVSDPAWRAVHQPDPDDPIEAPLAAANHRGRRADSAWLTAQLGLPFDDLVQRTDATTLSRARASPSVVASIDPERELDELLTWRSLSQAQARAVRDGDHADPSAYLQPAGSSTTSRTRVRVGMAASMLDAGWSLVFDGVEQRNPATGRIAEAVERIYGCTANVNGYLSLRSNTSFGTHWDDHEVVILQLIGAKDWEVRRPLALSMAKTTFGSATSDETVWTGRLDVGDALYIPRGWGHHVTGFDQLTYHHTITTPRINGLQATESIVAALADPVVGTDALPGVDLGGPASIPTSPPRSGAGLPVDLDADTVDRLVRRLQAIRRLSIAPRSYQSLSLLLDVLERGSTDVIVRCTCAGGWVVEQVDGDHVLAGMGGRQVAIATDVLAVVGALTDGLPHPMPDSGRAGDVARSLLGLGLLEATPR